VPTSWINFSKRAAEFEGESVAVEACPMFTKSCRIARGAKVGAVQAAYDAAYGAGKVEIFPVDDLVTGDFGPSLQGKM
jgi:hypothetical protein